MGGIGDEDHILFYAMKHGQMRNDESTGGGEADRHGGYEVTIIM